MSLDVVSAFCHGTDQGDVDGDPIYLRPPPEYEERFWLWLEQQSPREKAYWAHVDFAEEVLWQMGGNLYGRRTAAAVWRELFEKAVREVD
eukprot:5926006-Lingulodinium_polyedra.AAC.1